MNTQSKTLKNSSNNNSNNSSSSNNNKKRKAIENRTLEFYKFYIDMSKVSYGKYEIKPPLIKPSRLTVTEEGTGKELSDGYALNFAIGCTHACRFCYVDNIHKRFTIARLSKGSNNQITNAIVSIDNTNRNIIVNTNNNIDLITRSWGMYMLIPSKESFEYALRMTPWSKWKDKEVMLSSTHDPYLPELAGMTRKILEVSLPYGVRYCIQTRSLLVKNDFSLLKRYSRQIRLQVSIATLNERLARLIEPRVPLPHARLNLLKEAKDHGLKIGVIVAPIMPVENWDKDLERIFIELKNIEVDHVYGESLHARGANLEYIEEMIKGYEEENINNKLIFELSKKNLLRFDRLVGRHFNALLHKYNLNGRYWYEC